MRNLLKKHFLLKIHTMTAFSGIESLKSFGDGISGALSLTSSNTNFTIELLTFVPNYQIKIICKTNNI